MSQVIAIIIVFLIYSFLQELVSKKAGQDKTATEPTIPAAHGKKVHPRAGTSRPGSTPVKIAAVSKENLVPAEKLEVTQEKKELPSPSLQLRHSYRDLFLFKELLEPPLAKRARKFR